MKGDHALVFTFERTPHGPLPDVDRLGAALPAAWGPRAFDVFVPHPEHGRLSLFGDGEPPLVIVECHGDDVPALRETMNDARVHAALLDGLPEHGANGSGGSDRALPHAQAGASSGAAPSGALSDAVLSGATPDAVPSGTAAGHSRWRGGVFRIEREPVPSPCDGDDAPVALVVHYYGPVDDAAAFASHYVAQHPPILARLPGVRDVLCYVPVAAAHEGRSADPTVIRNEVRFDSMDALLASLRSPVLAELRADTKTFPRFGRSTHYPMLRRRFAAGR